MVKVFNGLYINLLTVIFFVVCYLSHKTEFFLISYGSMFLHECGHLTAALFIGLKAESISLHPFGVNLKLKSKFINSFSEEIILYLSGPLINLILAAVFVTVLKGRYLWDYGFAVNILLFFMNILPIAPLDGGCVLKKTLTRLMGENAADVAMRTVSFIISLVVVAWGMYLAYATRYNYSCVFLGALMIYNVFSKREMYSETAIKNLIFPQNKRKNKKPVRMFVSDGEFIPASYLKYINSNSFLSVMVLNDNGEIERIVTEKEIIKGEQK